jgi:hypothetical protein
MKQVVAIILDVPRVDKGRCCYFFRKGLSNTLANAIVCFDKKNLIDMKMKCSKIHKRIKIIS